MRVTRRIAGMFRRKRGGDEPKIEVQTELPPEGGTRATAVVVRRVSKSAFWRAITDYPGYPEFMPSTVECRVLETEADGALRVLQAIKVGPKKLSYTIRIVLDEEAGRVDWTLVEGKFKRLDGIWDLEELGPEELKITYVNHVDVGYAIPGWASKQLIGGTMPQVVERALERARSY